jgi:hypothetical protein
MKIIQCNVQPILPVYAYAQCRECLANGENLQFSKNELAMNIQMGSFPLFM